MKEGEYMILHRDCIFYKYTGTPNWRNIEGNKQDSFCTFSCDFYQDEVLKASFEWLDPIKVRDKIISSKRKSIKFFIFKESKILCIFSGSESQIAYTISKLLTLFKITLEKMNVFEKYKAYFLKSSQYRDFILTSFDIVKQQSGFDDSTYINISLNEVKQEKLADYISSPEILSFIILFQETQMHFSLDLYSVISFFDTDELENIYKACKRIVNDIV